MPDKTDFSCGFRFLFHVSIGVRVCDVPEMPKAPLEV